MWLFLFGPNKPNEWYLRIEGELMTDSILNKVATGARYIDLDGPSMREYFAKRKGERQRYQTTLQAVPPAADRRYHPN